MKQIMKMKSMLFGAMALLMLATLSFTLTSCDDDDDDVTFYGQWVINAADFDQELAQEVSQLAYDFTDKTTCKIYYKAAINDGSIKKGHWYIVDEDAIEVHETSETEGFFYILDDEEGPIKVNYSINGKKLTLTDGSLTLVFKATKGIKPEEMPLEVK